MAVPSLKPTIGAKVSLLSILPQAEVEEEECALASERVSALLVAAGFRWIAM